MEESRKLASKLYKQNPLILIGGYWMHVRNYLDIVGWSSDQDISTEDKAVEMLLPLANRIIEEKKCVGQAKLP